MEKFKLVCKKCESQNIQFHLGMVKYIKSGGWAYMQIKCLDCDNYIEIEETTDAENPIGGKHEICG